MRFDLIVNQFILEAFAHQKLIIYQKDYTRSFVHIRDVVSGLILGLDAPDGLIRGQIFNLGDDRNNLAKQEVVDLICGLLPKTNVIYEKLNFSGDMRDIRVSYKKIQKKLGFQAKFSVKDGIKEILHLLQSGIITNPFSERYRHAPLAVP